MTLVLALRVGDVDVERVRVLHDELAAAHQPEARAHLVAELHLDLVEVLRQVAVRAYFAAHEVGHHLLVRRAEAEVAVVAILDAQQLLAVVLPAPALLPELGGDHGRHQDLLRPGAVHLLADDVLDPAHGAQPERQEVVDAARDLADHAGAHQQLVADDLGVGGVLAERRREERATASFTAAALCSVPRHCSASPPWLHAAPAAIAIATKMTSPISSSLQPAVVAPACVCASMHHGHCVMCAMPSAISSFVFTGSAPAANAFWSKSRNAR